MMSWDEFKSAIIPAAFTVVGLWMLLVIVFTAGTVVAQ
jgi:hypothetical protein